MTIFTTPSVVIWFSTGNLGIFATLFYVFTMRVAELGKIVMRNYSLQII